MRGTYELGSNACVSWDTSTNHGLANSLLTLSYIGRQQAPQILRRGNCIRAPCFYYAILGSWPETQRAVVLYERLFTIGTQVRHGGCLRAQLVVTRNRGPSSCACWVRCVCMYSMSVYFESETSNGLAHGSSGVSVDVGRHQRSGVAASGFIDESIGVTNDGISWLSLQGKLG